METVKRTIEQEALLFLEDGLQELRVDILRAKSLLVDGKVIPCNQKLQGVLTKCDTAIMYIEEVRKESGYVAIEASPDAQPEGQPEE